jgi:hypothetical protein
VTDPRVLGSEISRALSAPLAAALLAASIVMPSVALAQASIPEPSIPERGESGWQAHVVLHGTATYGIGGWSALGAQLEPLVQLSAWNTDAATGTLDLGVVLGWQIEPELLQYGVPASVDNEAHRLNAWAVLGTSFHLGDRRSTLGLRVFAGWTHVWSAASIDDPRVGPARRLTDDYGRPNVGASLSFDYRFSDHLGLVVQATGPFPVEPSYVTTLFHVGLGVTGYLL